MFEKTKKFCDSFLDLGVPGFDLAVFKGGNCILRYMNGYSDIESKVKIKGDEKQNIYSCSKLITCTAALQLLEKGMFSLEDKLSKYMPEFENMTIKTDSGIVKAQNPILIKHLFAMTAGFSYDISSPHLVKCKEETEGRCPTRETMKYLAKEPLSFEPGSRWQYSLAHDVLAALVEVLTEQKFNDYVMKNIFDVVGMKNTTFMLNDTEIETISPQYRFEDGVATNIGKHIIDFKLGSEYASGGAGCISTVDDYISFLEGIRTGKLLKPETLKLMITDMLDDSIKHTYWTKETENYGYGLGVRCPIGKKRYMDFGWGGAACAYFAVDMENEISIYFGCHLLSSPAQGLRAKLYRLIRAELIDESEFADVKKELEDISEYNLTY